MFEQIGKCKIALGDCLEVMKEIPDKSIDCVLTDPPLTIAPYWYRVYTI